MNKFYFYLTVLYYYGKVYKVECNKHRLVNVFLFYCEGLNVVLFVI